MVPAMPSELQWCAVHPTFIKAAQFQLCLVQSRSMGKQDCYPNPNHNLLIWENAGTV